MKSTDSRRACVYCDQAESLTNEHVFPDCLQQGLDLSWATCSVRINTEKEKTMVYRCELKPGYRF